MLYPQAVIDAMSKNAMKGYNKVSKRLVVTDKQPYNYALAPMIAHMLPGAKFIHCTRDPISTCFSNYSTAFTQLHMHTHDLYWLGRYYADYERVMGAWEKLPEVEMIDLPYEELVSGARAPAPQSARLPRSGLGRRNPPIPRIRAHRDHRVAGSGASTALHERQRQVQAVRAPTG